MENMQTEPLDVSGTKRASDSPDDRDRKKSRGNAPSTATVEGESAEQPILTGSIGTRNDRTGKAPVSALPKSTKAVVLNEVLPPPAGAQNKGRVNNVAMTHSLSDNLPAQKKRTPQVMYPPSADFIFSQTIPSSNIATSSNRSIRKWLFSTILIVSCCCAAAFFQRAPSIRTFDHVIPPKHVVDTVAKGGVVDKNVQGQMDAFLSNVTLREFLTDPSGFHLGMAPSFFGFYGYFGSLAAWDEGLVTANQTSFLDTDKILSVAGASAGAMAAMLLAVGIPPRKAADFVGTIDLTTFADPPGVLSAFKGDKFEQLMFEFIQSQVPADHSMQMQDSKIPVAVTGFDLQTLSTLVMTEGCVARSARASATFPFLFQPVHWLGGSDSESDSQDYVLIDGGVEDNCGLEGLSTMEPGLQKRVVNMVVGNFGGVGTGVPPGPSEMPSGLSTSELLSISIRNLPQCGPWAMENGPIAVEGARRAMLASLDLPLYRGKEDGHYELHIDASSFVPAA
ncbi:K07001 NTE family protein [Seminavis robusta]|uniref:K07001 NTE family protein n=1 Tax=Seminavis robusta TaxID=568900 RepID=A0A9N8HHS2_9STRA|nr:K07001 NTE family protein [Seminavis robusta]|eukprot:Sro655_g182210.1 K07001 NTE family protein (507) ;mRNA; r:6372-8067